MSEGVYIVLYMCYQQEDEREGLLCRGPVFGPLQRDQRTLWDASGTVGKLRSAAFWRCHSFPKAWRNACATAQTREVWLSH